MKTKYKFLILLILSMLALSSCSEKNTQTLTVSEISEISGITESSLSEGSQEEISQDISLEISEESSQESSENSKEESSEITESSFEESSEAESSLSDESSGGAYFPDDEKIVKEHHTSQTLTDDSKFNELFENNSIDKECTDKMKDAVTDTEMRGVIGEFTDKWKEQAQTAYEKLKELLKDNPDELEALENSQKDLENELDTKKETLYSHEHFVEFGTMGLLQADTEIMNLYRSRAAVLYQQIFALTGNMEDI